jgi:RHS repeat-associated protein
VSNPRRFAGLWWDEATEVYFASFRVYDPNLGAFFSRDPLGTWGDAATLGNGYTYTAANPWSFVDPTGLTECPTNSDSCFCASDGGEWVEWAETDCSFAREDKWDDDVLCETLNGADDLHDDIHWAEKVAGIQTIEARVEHWWSGCSNSGIVDSGEYADIHDATWDIEDAMMDRELKIECESGGGYRGWCNEFGAYVLTGNRVHLCSSFWNASDAAKRKLYYHELHHSYNNWTDKGYFERLSSTKRCPLYDQDIANNQSKLRRNPDTYSAMAGHYGYFNQAE